MIPYFKTLYNGIFVVIPWGESTECFLLCVMWKWGSALSWWKSGAIVVWQKAPLQWLPVLLICEMRGGRHLQPLMVTCRIKELLLWMTLRTNEYEYICKNRHRRPSQCRLGVTVTLTGHGWWERESLPLEMEDAAGIRQTTCTQAITPYTIIHTVP